MNSFKEMQSQSNPNFKQQENPNHTGYPFSFHNNYNHYQQFYYQVNNPQQMFQKPPKSFLSQELGGTNFFNNQNMFPNQMQMDQNYRNSTNVKPMPNQMSNRYDSPEIRSQLHPQAPFYQTIQDFQKSQSGSLFQSKNSHENLAYGPNSFNMTELSKNLVYPPKKHSESSNYSTSTSINEQSKFNSRTMSIIEKKNIDDTKNLIDFLNSLDEDLIDYVRTQKGSR